MVNYNYKVVAELRSDLPSDERKKAVNKMEDWQKRLKIINIDSITYCKQPPFEKYNDFGAVAFFYAALQDMKQYFSHLEYYELEEGEKDVTV